MKEVYPGLFYFESENQRELAEGFKRLYGHHESPKLRKKIFSEKKFDSWFSKNTIFGTEYGLDFSDIVGGVNIPDWVFEKFLDGSFNPINGIERKIISDVKKIQNDKFYVISAMKNDVFNFKHEFAHGLYYLNQNYKDEINSTLSKISNRSYSAMEKELLDEGVTHENNLKDEIHAQLLTSHYVFLTRVSENVLNLANKRIESVFKKYYNNSTD